MDIITFTQGLHEQVHTMAETVKGKEYLIQASQMASMVKDLLNDLQQFVHSYAFQTPQEEIQFFKEAKPVLLSQYLYYKKRFDMTLYDSYKEPQQKLLYYEDELQKLEAFMHKHEEFVRYCVSGETYFDDVYFTRKSKLFSGLVDTRFSTGYDEKLAQLLANELLRKYILETIQGTHLVGNSDLTWTGSKTDAVELLVALHASGIVNKGEIDLRKFVQNFERCFNIQLGNFYDFIKNIRSRKGSRSNFIDALKEKLLQRLEQMEN